MMQADPAQLKVLIQAVEKWLIRARWRYAQYSHLMVIKLAKKIEWKREMYTTIQAYWRKCFLHQTKCFLNRDNYCMQNLYYISYITTYFLKRRMK